MKEDDIKSTANIIFEEVKYKIEKDIPEEEIKEDIESYIKALFKD